jgi:hypothetical protein
MDIEWPGSYCDKDKTVPHYMIEVKRISPHSIFRCKLCSQMVVLPNTEYQSIQLGTLMVKMGQEEGYIKYISDHYSSGTIKHQLGNLQASYSWEGRKHA